MASLPAFALAAWILVIASARAATEPPLQATTDDGRKVVLHPDGRWEFGSSGGAPAPAKVAQPKEASTSAGPDERYCQGGLFGVGRRICPGDPEYNRGSLNPKLR